MQLERESTDALNEQPEPQHQLRRLTDADIPSRPAKLPQGATQAEKAAREELMAQRR